MLFISLFVVLIFCALSTENVNHILVIAPPFFSHMLPSLVLAKQLSAHCHVTYLISASKIIELERKGFISTKNHSPTLDIIGLIDGNDEDLLGFELQDSQIGAKHSSQVIIDDRQKLLFNNLLNRMGIALRQLFHTNPSMCTSSLIQNCTTKNDSSLPAITTRQISLPIDTIIVRSFAPLPLYNFSIPIHLFLPSNLRGVVNLMYNTQTDETGLKEIIDYVRHNTRHATGFICNSLKEFDKNYIDQFHQLSGNPAPIRFIGPLVFNTQLSTNSKTKDIIDWLDKQPVASVIYIAFGSVARLPSSAIDTLARSLSNHSFIWSLKTQTSLPSSLMNLDSNRQLVLEWTPQQMILSHPAISFFFSHGGWNSLLEGMLQGKAILVWPFFGDQFDNALQLVEMGNAHQVSDDLRADIEHMLVNSSYSMKAKEIQQTVINARETTSKEEIINIARLVSNNGKGREEL